MMTALVVSSHDDRFMLYNEYGLRYSAVYDVLGFQMDEEAKGCSIIL